MLDNLLRWYSLAYFGGYCSQIFIGVWWPCSWKLGSSQAYLLGSSGWGPRQQHSSQAWVGWYFWKCCFELEEWHCAVCGVTFPVDALHYWLCCQCAWTGLGLKRWWHQGCFLKIRTNFSPTNLHYKTMQYILTGTVKACSRLRPIEDGEINNR